MRESISAVLDYIAATEIKFHELESADKEATIPTVPAQGIGRGIDESEPREG